MTHWFTRLITRWSAWTGDRDMETSIRKHLNQIGYFGSSAKFGRVRLAAVQRPGWIQVYRFEVRARVCDDACPDDALITPIYHDLYGLVKEDARKNATSVRVFTIPSERVELFQRWSDGLIRCRAGV